VLCYVKFAEDSNDYRKQEKLPLNYKEQNNRALFLIGIDRFKILGEIFLEDLWGK